MKNAATIWNHVKVPYGWCAFYGRICPNMETEMCDVTKEYYKCGKFRKVGSQGAIEEIDEDGQRRIYLEVAKGIVSGLRGKKRQRNPSQGQKVFNY